MKGATNEISDAEWEFFTGIAPQPLEDKVVLPNWASFDRQQPFNYFCSALPKVAKAIKWSDDGFNAWKKS